MTTRDFQPPPIKQKITDGRNLCDRTWAVWFRNLYMEQRDTGNTFVGLTDTPSSYNAQGLELCRVNTSENAVEFATIGSMISGTANEVEVAGTTSVTIGLPDDVTIGNDLTVSGDATVEGDLTVKGDIIKYDDKRVTAFGGPFNLQPTTIEYYLNSILLNTLIITYNTDNEVSTITNTDGDVWTATYDSRGRISKWLKS